MHLIRKTIYMLIPRDKMGSFVIHGYSLWDRERIEYTLTPMWCFERTGGVQAYFDAVTSEHIKMFDPDYYE